MQQWWKQVNSSQLAQGDLLPDCLFPEFTGEVPDPGKSAVEETISRSDLIIITQSCDLENGRATYVALCPIHQLAEFESVNPAFKTRGKWEAVRKGRVEGLHLLASPESPDDNCQALVVDFGHIISLPVAFLSNHADSLADRWRLDSPYLEHFSQAFARFFMRVGLPAGLPPFK